MAGTVQERAPQAPARTPAALPRVDSLTGLRFAAALLVFFTHLHEATGGLVYTAAASWVRAGYVGVSMFFVLSGFVLVWSHHPKDRAADFYRRRIARVYPNYFAAWLLTLLLFVLWGASLNPGTAVLHLFLLQAWVPDQNVYFGLNGVTWSLSCEAFFYLLFPLLLPRLSRCTPRRRRQLLALVSACVVVLPTLLWPVGGYQDLLHPGLAFWVLYVCPVARLLEFVAGMLLALEIRSGWRPSISLTQASALALVGYLLADLGGPTTFVAATFLPFCLLICCAATADLDGRPTMLARRTWVRLGEWSYAFYLLHQLVIRSYLRVWSPTDSWPATALVGAALLLVSVAGAAALWAGVERPARARINRWGSAGEAS